MNVVDYNTKIARNRDNYYRTARRMKKEHNRELDAQEKIFKTQSDKQLKSHQKAIERINEANREHLKETSNNANNLINQRESETRKLLRQMKDTYREERAEDKRDYSRKLRNISDAYRKAGSDQKIHYDRTMAKTKRNAKNIIEKKNRDNLEELDRFTRASEKTLKETKREMKADQEKLQKDWQNEKESILREASEKNLQTRNNFNKNLEDLKRIYRNELDFINKKNARNLEDARKKDTSALDNLNLTFNDKLNGLTDKFEYELRDIRHKNNLEKQRMERVHKSEMQAKTHEADAKIKIIGGKEKHDAETRKLVEKYEHRLDKLKTLMRDDGIVRLHQQEQGEENFKDEIMNQNLQHKEHIVDLNEDFDRVTRDKIERGRKEQTKIKDSFRRKIRTMEGEHEREMIQNNRLSKKRLENGRDILNDTIKNFSESSLKNQETLQEGFSRERTDLKRQANKALSEELARTRDTLEKKLDRTMASYEHRLDIKEIQKKDHVDKLERRIDYLEQVIKNKEQEYQTFETQTRADDRREMENRLKDQKENFTLSNKQQRKKFDETMRDIERKNKREVEKLVRDYERQLADLNIRNQRNLKRVMTKNKVNYDKVVKDSQNEREAIIQSYEDKINNMKTIYNENIERYRDLRSQKLVESVE